MCSPRRTYSIMLLLLLVMTSVMISTSNQDYRRISLISWRFIKFVRQINLYGTVQRCQLNSHWSACMLCMCPATLLVVDESLLHMQGPCPDARIVYIDGAFDLFHAGHVEVKPSLLLVSIMYNSFCILSYVIAWTSNIYLHSLHAS